MGTYAPLLAPSVRPTRCFAVQPPSHEPVAPMRRAQKNIGVLFFFGVEKKGKSGARFAGQKKSVEQLSFILNTKLYGRFRSHQKLRRII